MAWRRLLCAMLVLLSVTFPGVPVRAEEPSPKRNAARAIERGNDGIALYQQGRWSEALERFREAESLYHSPVFQLYAARSLSRAGRLLEARETYRKLMNQPLGIVAPAAWQRAQSDAQAELATLEGQLPSAVIVLAGASVSARVEVDDRPVVAGNIVELDPGVHRVLVTDGEVIKSKTFALAPGARSERVTIELAKAPARTIPNQTPALSKRSPAALSGMIALGVSGVLLTSGAVVGVLALNQRSNVRGSLPESCEGTTCPRSQKDDIEHRLDGPRRLGTAADVLFAGGAAAAIIGASLLIFGPSHTAAIGTGVSAPGGFVRVRF